MAASSGTNFLTRDFRIREPLLVSILVVITIVFSALTHAFSQAYDRRRAALGVQWFERGNEELQDNRPEVAIEDFRTALFYDPQNWNFSMQLANALTVADHTDQALNYYFGLWQRNPSSGPVNLQLARLYERKGNAVGAERYFNGAIFGDWPTDDTANRRTASLELINFYLARGDAGHAESQLIILSDNLPEDPQLHTRVGDLHTQVGDDQRALTQYKAAMQLDPGYLPAIQGAGEAAFGLGDYRSAQDYLTRAIHLDATNATVKKLLTVTQSVFLLNPYERGIPESEKIKRTLRAFELAGHRLDSCANSGKASAASAIAPFLDRWKQLKAIANNRYLKQHPEDRDTLFDFSTSAEKVAQPVCGEPSPEDSALLALAGRRETDQQ
ncbi:MAG TPA: tetratricopeptide repeat protein [Candidatus Eremiobacteraceae bacterium]|nr:tetratricopeptide repeat protein [Candidatus Eremiobacteraceae bacterium]